MGERRGTKALETWCRRVTQGYPGVKVENMTTSWRDGLAFCAMIHHFRPDLIDFSRLDKSDIYGNNELAFRIAERHLGIPALLDAEDMAEYPVPDRLSILTYLSQFYQAFASNSSSPIKKPTSESPDGSLVSLVQGNVQQSSKMEEGSSLRRREPCVICNNPVFIAQKLRIDGKLYHRTCFRCARCGTQLSIADYYETHDGQYCCETCPDEIIMDTGKLKQQQHEQIENLDLKQEQKIKYLPPEPPPLSIEDTSLSTTTTNTPIIAVSKDPSIISVTTTTTTTTPSASLVAIRRMMFDSYNKDTDDAKLIINKKDLSHINDSSLEKLLINNSNSDKINVNINNNNGDDDDDDDEIDKKLINECFIETKIIKKADKDNNIKINVSDNVNNTLDDNNMYKNINDKRLPLNKTSDSTEIDVEQVSVLQQNLDKQNDKEETNALHTASVINQNDLIVKDETIENDFNDKVEEEQTKLTTTDNNKLSNEIPTTSKQQTIEETTLIKTESIEYPDNLNPFGDDDEDEEINEESKIEIIDKKSTNPFGSDSEEEENAEEKEETTCEQQETEQKIHKSPSLNPFGSDEEDEDDDNDEENSSKKPVPLPRKNLLSPEPVPFPRSRLRGSLRSINSLSSTCSLPSPRKKKPAPQPPSSSPCSTLSRSPRPRKLKRAPLPPSLTSSIQSLQTESSSSLNNSTVDLSTNNARITTVEENKSDIAKEISTIVGMISDMAISNEDSANQNKDDNILVTPVKQRNEMTINDKELPIKTLANSEQSIKTPERSVQPIKTPESSEQPIKTPTSSEQPIKTPESLEQSIKTPERSVQPIKTPESSEQPIKTPRTSEQPIKTPTSSEQPIKTPIIKKKLITLPKLDFDDSSTYIDVIPPLTIKESEAKCLNESNGDLSSGNYSYISDSTSLNNSYCDSLASPPSEKKNKDSANMHRKISDGGSIYSSKSSHGQWRRKKAPAPPLPLPTRRPVQAMPIQNIRQELHDIEIKQQGLERQGVALENKIRDKFDSESSITPYVEELVLQLFELVNEKNELFRKQAELMYLRRQHHLEEEYAELEYQIRCLMARPEANKTDSDKELEEQLIQRLVDVVERRDAIVQCLEMDRLREAEEDKSINTQLGIFTLAMAKEVKLITKKKHKKNKDKHNSLKMMDLDKDVDETDKDSKKKKKWFTLQHIKGKHSQ